MNDTNPNAEALAAVLQALVAPPKPPAQLSPVRAHPETLNVLRHLAQAVADLIGQKSEASQAWHEVEMLNKYGQVERTLRVRRVTPPPKPNPFTEVDK